MAPAALLAFVGTLICTPPNIQTRHLPHHIHRRHHLLSQPSSAATDLEREVGGPDADAPVASAPFPSHRALSRFSPAFSTHEPPIGPPEGLRLQPAAALAKAALDLGKESSTGASAVGAKEVGADSKMLLENSGPATSSFKSKREDSKSEKQQAITVLPNRPRMMKADKWMFINTASPKHDTSDDSTQETSTDSTKEDSPNPKKETSTDPKKETSTDIQKETSTDPKKETSTDPKKETSKDIQKETSKDLKKEASKDLKKEASMDLKKETSTDLKKEISTDLAKESSTDIQKEASSSRKETDTNSQKEPTSDPKRETLADPTQATTTNPGQETSTETKKEGAGTGAAALALAAVAADPKQGNSEPKEGTATDSATATAIGAPQPALTFLEANKQRPGVVTLKSGLQYLIIRKGSGQYRPTTDSPCDVNYVGTFPDGRQFDSSYDTGGPASFAPNEVIGGWRQAMQMMVEGDKWQLVVPPHLGYGSHGSPPKIGKDATLVFEMEMLRIKGRRNPVPGAAPPGTHLGTKSAAAPVLPPAARRPNPKVDKEGVERFVSGAEAAAAAAAAAAASDFEAQNAPPAPAPVKKNPTRDYFNSGAAAATAAHLGATQKSTPYDPKWNPWLQRERAPEQDIDRDPIAVAARAAAAAYDAVQRSKPKNPMEAAAQAFAAATSHGPAPFPGSPGAPQLTAIDANAAANQAAVQAFSKLRPGLLSGAVQAPGGYLSQTELQKLGIGVDGAAAAATVEQAHLGSMMNKPVMDATHVNNFQVTDPNIAASRAASFAFAKATGHGSPGPSSQGSTHGLSPDSPAAQSFVVAA